MRLTLGLAAVASLLLASVDVSSAQGVWVEGAEQGQGVLRARGNECFVITPHHVVKDAIEIVVVGPQATRSAAELVRSFPQDLAILRVKDARSLVCEEWAPLDNFDAMLKTQAGGFLVATEQNGSRTRVPVTFTAHDEERVFVRPSNASEQIAQTMSGSLLLVNGAPAGVLLQRSNDEGVGEVYQIDDIMRLTEPFFAVARASTAEPAMDVAVATALLDRAVETRDGSQQEQNKAVAALLARGYDFANSNWSGLSLRGAVLTKGKFANLVMHVGNLTDADLRGATLQKAGLRFATMDRAQLGGAFLGEVYAPFVTAQEADLTGADLTGANFVAGDFRKANFKDAKLHGASLAFADLRGAKFDGADLTGAYLTGALLDGATFSGATLKDTDLQGASGTWDGLTAAQRAGACRHGILSRGDSGIVFEVDLMERWPSDRYDTGYQFEQLRTEQGWLKSFADRSLPLCRSPNDAAAAYRADYPSRVGLHVERSYIQKAGRRSAVVDRVNRHVKLLAAELNEARVLKGDGREVTAWEAEMRKKVSEVKVLTDAVLGQQDLHDVLLAAAGVQRDASEWARLAQQQFMREWQARKNDRTDAAAAIWPPFFPAAAPTYRDLPASTPELFRDWTLARAKALPKEVVLELQPGSAGPRIELGTVLQPGRMSRLAAVVEATGVPQDRLAFAGNVILAFAEPLRQYALSPPAAAGARISKIELRLAVEQVRPLIGEGLLPTPVLWVRPAAVRFRTPDGKSLAGSIDSSSVKR